MANVEHILALTEFQQRSLGKTIPIPELPEWPELPQEAMYGLAGDIVRAIDQHTEADPVALLAQFLVAFGNAVGRGPYFTAETDRHGTNLFIVLVGVSSRGRKGTAWGHIHNLFEMVIPDLFQTVALDWVQNCMANGLSSGEGLIWAMRDPIERTEPVREKGRVVDYQVVTDDPGVLDKRLLVLESEFAAVLKVLHREGNTLSDVIRAAWDTGNLRIMTKKQPRPGNGGAHQHHRAHHKGRITPLPGFDGGRKRFRQSLHLVMRAAEQAALRRRQNLAGEFRASPAATERRPRIRKGNRRTQTRRVST